MRSFLSNLKSGFFFSNTNSGMLSVRNHKIRKVIIIKKAWWTKLYDPVFWISLGLSLTVGIIIRYIILNHLDINILDNVLHPLSILSFGLVVGLKMGIPMALEYKSINVELDALISSRSNIHCMENNSGSNNITSSSSSNNVTSGSNSAATAPSNESSSTSTGFGKILLNTAPVGGAPVHLDVTPPHSASSSVSSGSSPCPPEYLSSYDVNHPIPQGSNNTVDPLFTARWVNLCNRLEQSALQVYQHKTANSRGGSNSVYINEAFRNMPGSFTNEEQTRLRSSLSRAAHPNGVTRQNTGRIVLYGPNSVGNRIDIMRNNP